MEVIEEIDTINYLALELLEELNIISPSQLQINWAEYIISSVIHISMNSELQLHHRILSEKNWTTDILYHYFEIHRKYHQNHNRF